MLLEVGGLGGGWGGRGVVSALGVQLFFLLKKIGFAL